MIKLIFEKHFMSDVGRLTSYYSCEREISTLNLIRTYNFYVNKYKNELIERLMNHVLQVNSNFEEREKELYNLTLGYINSFYLNNLKILVNKINSDELNDNYEIIFSIIESYRNINSITNNYSYYLNNLVDKKVSVNTSSEDSYKTDSYTIIRSLGE